ncbi:MAG: endonuclease III [Bacteroidota bacterium]
MRKSEKFKLIIDYFKEHQPDATSELHYESPYQLLVAVILSAQCTDKRVNIITPPLFERFPDVYSLANASIEEIFSFIKSCSYPNNKSKSLSGMAQKVVSTFNGEIPSDLDDLQKLPGVGRKTANVISSVIFNQPSMAVDTHVFRVSNRMGLSTNAKTPLQVELQLVKYIPQDLIPVAHHWLILHGRYVCIARKPKCDSCPFTELCDFYKKNLGMC